MLTAGAACPPELGQQSSKLLPHPAQRGEQRPRSRLVTHSPPPHHSMAPSAWKRCTGSALETWEEPSTYLSGPPSIPASPSPGSARGQSRSWGGGSQRGMVPSMALRLQ